MRIQVVTEGSGSAITALASWRLLTWSLVLCPVVVSMTSPRVFTAPHLLDLLGGSSYEAQRAFSSQVYRLVMLYLALLGGGLTVVWRRQLALVALRSPLFLAGSGLAVSLLASAAFGTRPLFAPGLVVWPLLFAALAAIPPIDAEALLGLLRRKLRILVVLSALSAAVLPDWGLETDYRQSYIAGWDWRLHGVLPHANSLGPICALLILLELQQGGRWRWLLAAFTTAVLLATQSKTSLAAVAVAAPLLLAAQGLGALRARFDVRMTLLILGWSLALLATMMAMLWPWVAARADDLMAERGREIRSLTGRTELWRITVDSWRGNPWFGDGPGLWDQEMVDRNVSILDWMPGHAHSQTMQALGQSGFAGLAAWFGYLLVLAWMCWRAPPGRAALGWGLLLVMIIDSLSEPWFSRDLPPQFPLLLYVHLAFTTQTMPHLNSETEL